MYSGDGGSEDRRDDAETSLPLLFGILIPEVEIWPPEPLTPFSDDVCGRVEQRCVAMQTAVVGHEKISTTRESNKTPVANFLEPTCIYSLVRFADPVDDIFCYLFATG